MGNWRVIITSSIIISLGLLYVHPAFAHNFASDESAGYLGKIANLQAELQALQMDLSDPTAVSWHVNKINGYWTTYDTQQMAERNQLLATEIPGTINSLITMVTQPNPDVNNVTQQIDTLNGYLAEGITARIDQDKLQNATVQALADTDIIKETLADYGQAINSTVDLNDMSKMQGMGSMNMGSMNNSSMSGSQGGMSGMKMGSYDEQGSPAIHLIQMSGMSGMSSSGSSMSGMNMQSGNSATVPIVNIAAYHSAQTHAQEMKTYYDKNVVPLASANMSAEVQTADTYMSQLIDAINNKEDGNTIMVITHMHIHPALITAFNLPLMKMSMNMGSSTAPEFPMPALLALVSIIGVITITRFIPKLR
jgi:hypothetical protein